MFAYLYPMRLVSLETNYSKWIGKGEDVIFFCQNSSRAINVFLQNLYYDKKYCTVYIVTVSVMLLVMLLVKLLLPYDVTFKPVRWLIMQVCQWNKKVCSFMTWICVLVMDVTLPHVYNTLIQSSNTLQSFPLGNRRILQWSMAVLCSYNNILGLEIASNITHESRAPTVFAILLLRL
jgi:hypothetical protein